MVIGFFLNHHDFQRPQRLGQAHVFAVHADELCVDWHATLAGGAPSCFLGFDELGMSGILLPLGP